MVAAHELRDRRLAHVVVHDAAEQVVEHAVAQRRLGDRHRLDVELVEHRVHDREAAGQHGRARRLEARDAVGIGAPGVDEQVPQPVEALARDAVGREPVLEQDALDAARAAGGADRLAPARAPVALRHDGELLARLELGGLQALLVDAAVRESA